VTQDGCTCRSMTPVAWASAMWSRWHQRCALHHDPLVTGCARDLEGVGSCPGAARRNEPRMQCHPLHLWRLGCLQKQRWQTAINEWHMTLLGRCTRSRRRTRSQPTRRIRCWMARRRMACLRRPGVATAAMQACRLLHMRRAAQTAAAAALRRLGSLTVDRNQDHPSNHVTRRWARTAVLNKGGQQGLQQSRPWPLPCEFAICHSATHVCIP
jgi:hypothetical protein